MHYCQHLHTIGKDDIIDNVAKLSQSRGPYVLPDNAEQCWHELNPFQHLTNPSDEPVAQTRPNRLEAIERLPNVRFGTRPEDHRQAHGHPLSESRTSRHGRPSPGLVSASARRWANSTKCHSGTSCGSTDSGRLSQIWSIKSSLSRTVSFSIPSDSKVAGMSRPPRILCSVNAILL